MSHPLLFFSQGSGIGPEEAKHFAEGLKLNTTLKKLDLAGSD
jgi:hypothetical protein